MDSKETHNEVLVAADIAGRSEDWPALWELRDRLRETDLWVGFYGPSCAVAGWHVDREAGRSLLVEVIAGGFHQPEMFAEEFASTFATEPAWTQQQEQMRSNVPAPPIELLDWPDYPRPWNPSSTGCQQIARRSFVSACPTRLAPRGRPRCRSWTG